MPVTAQFNSDQLVAPSPRIGGSVMHSYVGAPLPTSSFAPVDNSFTDLGYLDQNGIRNREDRRTDDTFAWGGSLVGTIQQSYSRTMVANFLQLANAHTLAMAYGTNNVVTTPATTQNGNDIAAALNANLLDEQSWIFDGFYGPNNILVRLVLPNVRIISLGEVNFTHRAFAGIEATLKAFPDTNNNFGYFYINDGENVGGS